MEMLPGSWIFLWAARLLIDYESLTLAKTFLTNSFNLN